MSFLLRVSQVLNQSVSQAVRSSEALGSLPSIFRLLAECGSLGYRTVVPIFLLAV